MVYFVDANIFLELDQEHANECETFLEKVRSGVLKAVTTSFHVDSVLVVMENYVKAARDFRIFLSSLIGYKGLKIYFLSLFDRIMATKYMERLNIDFDDALAY